MCVCVCVYIYKYIQEALTEIRTQYAGSIFPLMNYILHCITSDVLNAFSMCLLYPGATHTNTRRDIVAALR